MRVAALAGLGMAAIALAVGSHAEARAEGAIAVGSTGNVERDGIAFGMASDEAAGKAGDVAVQRCRTFEAKRAASRCQVVATFSGECFAIAYDPEVGKPGAGWGVGADQLLANQKAVAMCEEAAGAGRKGYCQVERFGCDSGPKLAPKIETEAPKDAIPQVLTPEAKPGTPADAKPVPGTDAKAPDGKTQQPERQESKAAAAETKHANAPSEPTKEPGQAPPRGGETAKDADSPHTKHEATPEAAPTTPPSRPTPPPSPQPNLADRAGLKGQRPSQPLLPVMALAGVGLAYAVGQRLRGKAKGGIGERQIITGGALAVLAAIAVKILDLLGVDASMVGALTAVMALGAAIFA